MVVLRFTLKSIHLNLPMTLFHIWTPLWSNKLTMMDKWTNSWNSSTQSMMMIFWMLTSIWFRIDYWLLLPQNFIQLLLCCLMSTEEKKPVKNLMLQFFMFIPTKANVKLVNGNMGHYQRIGIILCFFPNCHNQFINIQVTLTTPSQQVPLNVMLVFKRLYIKLLNNCDFFASWHTKNPCYCIKKSG